MLITNMRLYYKTLVKAVKPAMDLKQFMRRTQVLKLYRDLLRASRRVEDKEYQNQLKTWIRSDFRTYQHLVDSDSINIYITYGNKCLNELETSLAMAK